MPRKSFTEVIGYLADLNAVNESVGQTRCACCRVHNAFVLTESRSHSLIVPLQYAILAKVATVATTLVVRHLFS